MGDDILAHKVCERLWDVFLAQNDLEFADLSGGLDKLENEARKALSEYHASIPETDCRDII